MTWFNLTDETQAYYRSRIKVCNVISTDFHKEATPFDLCVEMIDKVGAEVNEEKNWLVIANLEFVIVLKEYFKFRGWNFEKVSFATPCDIKEKFARKLGVVNIVRYEYTNFKEWKLDMKFDVIVGNPPYQDGTLARDGCKTAKTLWPYFLKNSLENLLKDEGYLALITPQSWMGPGKQLLRSDKIVSFFTENQLHYVNFECGKYFTVGSSFSYYVLQKTPNFKLTEIRKNNQTIFHNLKNLPFIPNGKTELVDSLVFKTLLSKLEKFELKSTQETRSDKINVSKLKTEEFIFPIKHTNTETLFSKETPSNFHVKKVLLNSTGTFRPIYDDGEIGTSQSVRWIVVKNKEEGNRLIKYLLSPLIAEVLYSCRYSGSASSEVLRSIPKIDLSKDYSDEELYEYFNLTQEEINTIKE